MATKYLRGALVEYKGAFPGPFPNIVIFQFNPEQVSRSIAISNGTENNTNRRHQETGVTAAPPLETLNLTALFSAADDLGAGGVVSAIPRLFGVGPQLAALEKMVQPPSAAGLLGAALDAVGAALTGASASPPTRQVPREQVPRLLFIWGLTRVLPARIQSLSITEQKFDQLLNPVEAQVQMSLSVVAVPPGDDEIAKGALAYSKTAKDVQAVANLANTVKMIGEIIPF